ncbi:MAG TPA: RNA methyltransferase, partial [Acidobacteriota bacterium]|nr:RNA methyltransferase [Acidobacteriota bacterium]
GENWMIEGKKLFREAVASGVHFDELFVTEWQLEWVSGIVKSPVTVVPEKLLKKISSVQTPQGILGIAKRPAQKRPALPKGFAALLTSIRDPGNVGTMIRAAEATSCDWIATTADCADPYQPKAIRASMGSIFRLPPYEVTDAKQFLADLSSRGVTAYGLSPHSGFNLFETTPQFPAVIVIGSESTGLPPDLRVKELRIPMQGKVESLNAAMAATVCFYHFAQHAHKKSE